MNIEVNVEYIGNKPWTVEKLTGFAFSWNGKGDVKPLPEKLANQLVKAHPDQWRLCKSEEGDVVGVAEALQVLTNSNLAPKVGRGRKAKAAAELAAQLAAGAPAPVVAEPEAPVEAAEAPAETAEAPVGAAEEDNFES